MSKYEVGDKFVMKIVTVNEDKNCYPYLTQTGLRCGEKYLEMFDRLDSDYINEHFGDLQDEAYNRGLVDAWELAKKIQYELTRYQLKEIFGTDNEAGILSDAYTPQEALAKLKAYEEAQEIKVGDVVINDEKEQALVLSTHNNTIWVINEKGTVYDLPMVLVKKTGKHLDIQQIFEQIGE